MSRETHLDIGVRRFSAGERFDVAGFRLRIEAGRKADRDLRLDLYDPGSGRWVPVPMSMLLLMYDFMWENEHVLYPPSLGYMGGRKLTEALHRARKHGWVAAARHLNAERSTSQLSLLTQEHS